MDVTEILDAHKAQFKPITVEKLVPLDYDVNLLSSFDTNAFDEKRLANKNKREEYLKELTRDNTQLIINEIFKLPVQSGDNGVLAKLPVRSSTLPREKPLPKDKPLTRWEKFAKVKGIQNRKRERMVYDEEKEKYVPRWGYAGGQKDKLDDWLIEVPQNADPMEDQYAKRDEEKRARVEKNKKRQQRNLDESLASMVTGKGKPDASFGKAAAGGKAAGGKAAKKQKKK
ncbi:ribosome biogenesis regulatory protein-domain-containing protein [Zychaea mexicana]|uniref:ribosome biogenesis regulatory protein-domain-containing protein n=1 Tax=Zychaea mexicana TaxID=64656 RepID=UPI0022FF1956|nr:ribosome biogenesis regulatory protein-domain-containing protein [Zychaea mexicana]KAI9497005.1 ribosome biogenesis regulatory protein-domain-containing protein [Zychaea mexicana]